MWDDSRSSDSPAALPNRVGAGRGPPRAPQLRFHYVPKHASWLNMVEIEIGVLASQCLARRILDLATLTPEVYAWIAARNQATVAVKWMFGIEQARLKLGHAYPSLSAAAGNVAA